MDPTAWRKVAPTIFKETEFFTNSITAKTTSDGKVRITTSDAPSFRIVQRSVLAQRAAFYTHNFPEDRPLKVILKGITTVKRRTSNITRIP